MEIIKKPQPPATETLSIRVAAGLRKEYAKAREQAERQNIDLMTMMSTALSDVFKAVAQASSKVTAIS
jgi:hypothetical protein